MQAGMGGTYENRMTEEEVVKIPMWKSVCEETQH